MPVPYTQRRRRREQLAAELSPELQGRITLRQVEAVSKFSPQTQRTLAAALEAGSRAPAAVAFLKEHPAALLEEVVQNCRTQKRRRRRQKIMEAGKLHRDQDPALTPGSASEQGAARAAAELTDLLTYCYPDMPRLTAEAMAGSELMTGVLEIIRSQHACFAAPPAESDFVLVVLCGLAHKTVERLDRKVAEKPIYRQALQQSGVHWPGLAAASQAISARTGPN